MYRQTTAIMALLLLWPNTAVACPPPPVLQIVAPERQVGEDDTAYFDRLARMRMWVVPPPRSADETEEQFVARSTAFDLNFRLAAERRQQQDFAALRAAELREESGRWASADQIVLAEVVARTGNGGDRFILRVIDRHRGARGLQRVQLSYGGYTSCGPYPPQFGIGERYVLFAPSGPISSTTLIGYYGLSSAQDERTRRWIEGIRPDGTPVSGGRQPRR